MIEAVRLDAGPTLRPLALFFLALTLGLSTGSGRTAAARSLFLSYGSENECVAGHVLGGALCRSAFAKARAEFEARTTAFPSLARCEATYGDCAPWPTGGLSTSIYRPRWQGVDIVDTPHERSVTPSVPAGAKRLTFAAMPLTESHPLDVRPGPGPMAPPRPFRRSAARGEAGPATPSPGSGFTLEDGVLTYPAPARFLPKNLTQRP